MVRLLEISDLTVAFQTADGTVQAVGGVSYGIDAGRTLGIVGESGSGKSVTSLTLLGLNAGATTTGSILFDGRELVGLGAREFERLRGSEIAMIFQDPLSSLHPHYRVGWQIAEAIRNRTRVGRAGARAQTIELLRLVNIPQPDRRVESYPHELSGGMRQRVMIAMALALRPKLLIADEPTTALDATVQAQILELIQKMQRDRNMALMIITHDLGVVANIADAVVVMYAGRVVEQARSRSLFYAPHHPYTRGLLGSVPSIGGAKERLIPIVGQPPSLINLPRGCSFHRRCPFAMDACITERPPLVLVPDAPEHLSACWLPIEVTGTTPGADAARRAYAASRRGERAAALPGVMADRAITDSAVVHD